MRSPTRALSVMPVDPQSCMNFSLSVTMLVIIPPGIVAEPPGTINLPSRAVMKMTSTPDKASKIMPTEYGNQ